MDSVIYKRSSRIYKSAPYPIPSLGALGIGKHLIYALVSIIITKLDAFGGWYGMRNSRMFVSKSITVQYHIN
jgi:hypothetical protein